MAAAARATHARVFMQNCRQHSLYKSSFQTNISIRHESTDISHLRPSNFNQPLRFREVLKNKTNPSTSSKSSNQQDNLPNESNINNNNSSSGTVASIFPSSRPTYSHPTAKNFKPATEDSSIRFTPWVFIKGLFGFKPIIPPTKPPPFHIHNNPYRARKKWPPDFSTVHPKQQFHYEKTYRRRAKLKWARPTWNKWVKLVQNTLIVSTLIYFIFICEPAHEQGTPFDGFRAWFFTKMRNLGTLPDSTRAEVEKLEQEARGKAERRAVN